MWLRGNLLRLEKVNEAIIQFTCDLSFPNPVQVLKQFKVLRLTLNFHSFDLSVEKFAALVPAVPSNPKRFNFKWELLSRILNLDEFRDLRSPFCYSVLAVFNKSPLCNWTKRETIELSAPMRFALCLRYHMFCHSISINYVSQIVLNYTIFELQFGNSWRCFKNIN